jgi:hypothetical protein
MTLAKSGCYRLGRTWRKEDTNLDHSPESAMRPATVYYMAQVSSRRTYRQVQRDAPPDAAGRGRHARVPRRGHPERGLPAFGRRILAMMNGTS